MMNNFIRFIAVSIYPIILLVVFLLIYRKNKYKQAIINNIKPILLNLLIVLIVMIPLILIFFYKEDNIYVWDYSGHWIRALNLRQVFFEDPTSIFSTVFDSMNNTDYSSLPALFSLPFIIINTSYSFFCFGNFVCFLLPSFVLLEILYFAHFNEKKYLPSIVFLAFFPSYLPLFDGKPCACGMIFIIASYMLIFFEEFNDIDTIDVLSINLFAYISIFERRWYLYSLVALYLSFIIKYLFSYKKLENKILPIFNRLLLSGCIALIAIFIFNKNFLYTVLNNNYSETYSTYSHDGNLLGFIKFYSIIIVVITLIGYYYLFKKKKDIFVICLFSFIITTVMFLSVQSFENHHHYINMINIIIPLCVGLYYLPIKKWGLYCICALLLIQSCIVFTDAPYIPIFTYKRKTPIVLENKQEYADFCHYIKNLLGKDEVAYICGSNYLFNEDIIRNSILPDLDLPVFEYAQTDLIDGFPDNIDYIRYLILTDPIQYYDEDSQHVHKVLNDAILYNDSFKKIYTYYDTYMFDSICITIYEKTGNYTQEDKQYLYDEIIKYYPNNQELFSEILK